uniref:FG-GAP repeat protein n=1 Tax=Solibacter usitatus (strain Ellin6076) TaxID=234267 RepID=Q02B46_SOLUE
MLKTFFAAVSLFSLVGSLDAQTVTFTQAASSPYVTSGVAPKSLSVADLNLDGVLDVIVANSGTPGNGANANYTAWLGLKTAGAPNGALGNAANTVGAGTAISFFSGGANDRAVNVAIRRANAGYLYGCCGTAYYPAIIGAGLSTSYRQGAPWNTGSLTNFVTSIGSGANTGAPFNPSNGFSYWTAAGDFNGEGLDGAAISYVSAADSVTPLNYITVLFGSGEFLEYASATGINVTMPGFLVAKRVFVADLNHDGKADLIVTTATNQVVVFISQSTLGTGSAFHGIAFAAPLIIPTSGPSEFVTIGDVNGDGKKDLVVSTGTPTLTIIPGNGDGSFGSPVDLTLSAGNSLYAAVGDFTHDGKPDLAVANGSNILIYPGVGTYTFATAPTTVGTGGGPVFVAGADMNNDGKLDLIAANSAENTVAVLLNTTPVVRAGPGLLTFNATAGGSNPPSQSFSVVFDTGGTPSYTLTSSAAWLSTNPSSSGSTSPITISTNITGLAAGTYRGTVTVATSSSTNTSTINVTLNVAGPAGTLKKQAGTLLKNGDSLVVTGDFTGHGRLDLVGALSGCGPSFSQVCLYTYPSNGDGTFGTAVLSQLGATNFQPGFGAAGDFNGDGKLDFVVYNQASAGGVRFFYGNGDGTFTIDGASYFTAGGVAQVQVADLNSDGKPDVVVAAYGGNDFSQGQLGILLNNGDGTFANTQISAPRAYGIVLGDFNRDGFIDIVVANIFADVSYFQGNGNGTFAAAVSIASTAAVNGAYTISAGDFNNDGKLDVAVGGAVTSGKLSILLGNGDGTFTSGAGSPYALVGLVVDTQVGDFNGDGNLDVVVRRGSQGTFSVMLGDGSGAFSPGVDFTLGNNGSIRSAFFPGDFSGDGKTDVIVPDNSWTLWLGDLASTTTVMSSVPATSAPQGQNVAFTETVTAIAPAFAVPGGQGTITDSPDGQLAQANLTVHPANGTLTTSNALSLGAHTLTAAYAGDSRTKASSTSAAFSFNVVQAHLSFTTAPVNTNAGVDMANIVVKVLDPSNAVVTGSTASITIALDHNSISSGTTTVAAVAGVATFTNVKINLIGAYTMTASSTGLTSANANFSITPGPIAQFTVAGFPNPATVNLAGSFTVTAQDAGNNVITGYTGTAHFTSSDGAALLPADYIFTAGDNGVHTFSATLKTVGSRSITATDTVTSSVTGSQTGIIVQVGAPAILTPTGTPQSAVVNTNYGAMSVTLTDAGGNPANGQTITFTAPGSGASGLFGASLTATAVTSASGVATLPAFTANTIAGTFNLHANIGAVATDFVLTNLGGAVNSLAIQTGDNQATAINTAYPTALSVLAKDAFNNPVSGVTITFSMPVAGASATFPGPQATATANTNAAGIATAPTLTANGTAGAIANATATIGALSQTFHLTNLTGAPAHLTITAGSGQSTLIGTAFATQFTANVTDAGNNPIQNVVVTFTAPSSGKSGTFPGSLLAVTSTTDASGNATAPVFTANTVAGAYNVAATANGLSANVGLTNTPGPALMTIVQGDPQSAVIGTAFATPLVVKVADNFGNPCSGISVTFTPTGAAATAAFSGAATVSTTAAGLATAPTLTANNQVGAYTVGAASAAPALSKTFNLNNTFGPPAILTATAGTPQSALVNTAFATALSVKVTDSGLNALSGITVTFTAPASGAGAKFSNSAAAITAITDGSGVASVPVTANTVAGLFAVSATVNALTATYSLTNTPGAAILTINGGNNQNAVTTTVFTTPLSAKVADGFGNPYSGTSVTFTAPASGASGSFANNTITTTVATNAGGIATATAFTANNQLGGYSVSAASAGLTSVSYSLSNITGPPANVLAVTGTPQSAVISTAFATALTAKVTDIAGNPLSGIFVTFAAAPAGNGAGGAFTGTATVATNGSGIAIAPMFTANTVAGVYSVKATVVGGLSGSFNLTNLPGPPALITASGTPQSALLNAAYNTLSVKITDASNNPISGLSVLFTANAAAGAGGAFPAGSATASVSTDANGNATAPTFTANGILGAFTVRATSGALSSTFNLTNIVNPPAAILVVTGSSQFAQLSTGFPLPLTAKVVDVNGAALSNVSVTFTLPSSGASAAFAGSGTSFSAVTNSQGLVTTPSLAAGPIAGIFNAVASTGALSANFALTIGTPPAMTIDPSGFFFRYDTGLTIPPAQTANVENAFGNIVVAADASWVKPRALSNGGSAYGISVSVDPAGLAPGTYYAGIVVSQAGGRQSVTVRVTFVIVPQPQLGSGPTNLTFRYLQGGPVPPEQTDTIIGLSRNVPFTLATEQITAAKGKWLNVAAGNSATSTPVILHVSVSPVGFDAGTYQGVIHVTSPEVTNSPYDIGVTLIVTAPVIPPVITSIVNAASFENNAVSGNEILSMFGTNLGCAAGPQVTVDGVAAVVLGGTATQVNWIAPDLGGRSSIQVQFACGTLVSNLYSMSVVAVAPGIFTADGKQVAAYNAGYTLNGPAIPIARGQVVMLFGTGFGSFAGVDADGFQLQTLPVTATVGGVPATLTYSGLAPGLPGVNQVNVLIPAGAPTGPAVPLVVTAGGTAVTTALTIAVR